MAEVSEGDRIGVRRHLATPQSRGLSRNAATSPRAVQIPRPESCVAACAGPGDLVRKRRDEG